MPSYLGAAGTMSRTGMGTALKGHVRTLDLKANGGDL